MHSKAAAVERRPSGTNVLLPSTPPNCIICRSCKQPVHLDDIGDHDCSTAKTVNSPLAPPAVVEQPKPSVVPSPRPSLSMLPSLPLLQPTGSAATPPLPATGAKAPPPLLTRKSSISSNQSADIQARVTQVTVNALGFATYRISSTLWPNGPQFTVDRRYRDFYAFATLLQLMLPPQSAPTKSLWVKLPPKTYCSRNTLSDAFLLRRKAGLEGFLSAAIDMLMNPKNTTGPIHKRTLTQMHVLREFLGIPAARDVQGAVRDAKRLGLTSDGWTLLESVGPHDHTFEQRCDGFNTIKRVAMVPFPPRAIFDLLVLPPHQAAAFNPTIVGGSLVRKESTSLWVEHVQLKTVWFLPGVECVNVKSWRLEPNGTIIVVSIPAAECPPHVTASAQNVLTGWILSPVDATSTSVTMVTQMDLKGHIGPNSPWNKLALRNYAMDLTYLRCHLDESYDKAYYDALGPLVSPDELHAVTLHPHDMQIPGAGDKDPKVFVVCQQIEPLFCLLIHKNTNRNALILKLNVTNDDDAQTLHMTDPLVGEWVMFEKAKNPRQSMSAIERNTTYQWTTKHLGQGVHAIQFGMLKGRTFQLRNHAGYFLHGTLNGNPNVMLKRFYLTFAPSMVGLGQLEKIELVGETETEVVYVR